jgi:uncharacterized damage-inducible protein DinB
MLDLLTYHRWATLRTLEPCLALTTDEFERDLGGSFPSVRHTLAHLYMADSAWLHRVRGEAYAKPAPGALPEDLSAAWLEVLDGWRAVADSRNADDVIAYRAFDGTPYRNRLEDIARHVVNHGSYHRGQVAMMLRLLGHAAQGTDLIAFTRAANA